MEKYFLIILIVLIFCLISCDSEPMTEEERAAYEASRTREYKVVSVYQYTKTITNRYGGIISQNTNYCFTYIGNDGQLHQFEDFYHTEYGLFKLRIGDENKYVVKEDGFDTYRFLYLTEETLVNMKSN